MVSWPILACSSRIVSAEASAFFVPLPKASGTLPGNCFFQSVIWLAYTSNFLTNSAMVRSPWITARATLTLNSGEQVRLFRFIISLQSLSLMMEEALILVQLPSGQRGPFLFWRPADRNTVANGNHRCCAKVQNPLLLVWKKLCYAQPRMGVMARQADSVESWSHGSIPFRNCAIQSM